MPHPTPLIIGHRGAPGYRPEHTRSAFELAIAQGADAVEIDLVPSRDGQLVVRHENELSGTTDVAAFPDFADRRTVRAVDGVQTRGWFAEDFTWPELQRLRSRERLPRLRPQSAEHDGREPILRLQDVLAISRTAGIRTVVELKHAATFARAGFALDELLAAAIPADQRDDIVVESFEKGVLRTLADRGWHAPLVYLMERNGSAPDADGRSYARERRDLAQLEGLAGISVPLSLARPRLVERAAAGGLDVWTWTLRPENVFLPPRFRTSGVPSAFGRYKHYWREIAESGVAAVFADHPDLARRAFAGHPGTV